MSTLRSGLYRPGIILYLAFIVLFAWSTQSAPIHESDSTHIAEYDTGSNGCYYNFQRYQEGARIITNEPCLNCTCHNRMLMCYLRVCPFTKAIGQDCMVEKRPDQCCPVITCPEVPVQLLTSTTTPSSMLSTFSSSGYHYLDGSNSSPTELGFPDTYGCNVDNHFFADGVQLPIEANNPCELCYCIRNKTTCLMQQCTLSVAGCRPVYQSGICCPVKYNCEYDKEYEIMAGTTPGLIMTTTLTPHTTLPQCHYDDKIYEDGELIYTIQPCQHCYCFHGEIVCAVQECGKPMESHGKNCTAVPPLDGECCPTTYQCDDGFGNIATEISEDGNKKNTAKQSIDQEENKQQETFPGADNTIPEQVIHDYTQTTDKPLIITPLGNEVLELELQESTKSSINGVTIEEENFTTLQYEVDKLSKPTEQQPQAIIIETDNSNLITAINTNIGSSKISTNSVNESLPTTEISVTMSREITSEFPSRAAEENNQDISKQENLLFESTILTNLPTESKISQFNIEFTTPIIQEKEIETSTGRQSINGFTTDKQMEELEKSPVKSSIIDNEHLSSSQINLITTERGLLEETTSIINDKRENSSESSSPISEIKTTEQSGSRNVTESVLYTFDKGYEKPIDGTDVVFFTTERDLNTIMYTSEKVEDSVSEEHVTSVNYDVSTVISPNQDKKIQKSSTPIYSKTPTTYIYNDDNQFEQTNVPINSENLTEEIPTENKKSEEITTIKNNITTIVISSDEPNKNDDTISIIENSTVDNKSKESLHIDFSTARNTDEVKIFEDIDTVINIKTTTITNSDETKNNTGTSIGFENSMIESSITNKQLEEGEIPINNETSIIDSYNGNKKEEVTNETINSEYSTTETNLLLTINASVSNNVLEKSDNVEKSSESSTEIQFTDEKVPFVENNDAATSEKQSLPEISIPERVPEHKAEDKDAVTEVTEEYFMNGSDITHRIDNEQTDRPEYGITTYLPPHDFNFEVNRQPSTSIYETLPKENSEIDNNTTELSISSKSPSKTTTTNNIVDESEKSEVEKEHNIHMSEEEQSIDETGIKQITSTNLPGKQTLADIEFTQNITSKLSLEETSTQSTRLINQSLSGIADKSEVNAIDRESTFKIEVTVPTIFKDDYTEILAVDVNKINENNLQLEDNIYEPSKGNKTGIEISDIKKDTKQNPEKTFIIQFTRKPVNDQEVTDRSATITSLVISNNEPDYVGEHHTTTELSTNMQLNVSKTTFDMNSSTIVNDVFEETYGNTKVSTEDTKLSIVDEISQAADTDETVSEKIDEEKEYKSPSDVSIDTIDHELLGTSMQPELPTDMKDHEIKHSNQENIKDETLTKFANRTKLIEEDKLSNVNSHSAHTDSIIDLKKETVTYTLGKEIMSTVDNAEQFTEQPYSSESILKNENEFNYSTEDNLIRSQIPELEVKIPLPPEMRPAPGIPGEGNCLVDGQSYSNNSAIPPANSCQLSCRCVSSIVQCELIKCSPPPTDLPNCTPIYTEADYCCPMYTCDATSNVELEAGNQMSHYHTSTSEEKLQTEATQNPSVEEHTHTPKINVEQWKSTQPTEPYQSTIPTKPTENTFKLQFETSDSTSVNSEPDKLTIPSILSIEEETVSPSMFIEMTTTTFEEPNLSLKVTEETQSPILIDEINMYDKYDEQNLSNVRSKVNDTQEETTFVTTELFSTISIFTTEETNKNIPSKISLEFQSQSESNKFKDSISKDDLSEHKIEDTDSTLYKEMTLNNLSDEEKIRVSTQSSVFTELKSTDLDSTQLLHNAEKIKQIEENEKPESASQTAMGSIEPIENEIKKISSDYNELFTPSGVRLNSLDMFDNTTPIIEEQLVEKEREKLDNTESKLYSSKPTETSSVEINELSTDINTKLSINSSEKQFTQSTIFLTESTSKPDEIELKYLTTISPNKVSTLIPIISEFTEKNENMNILYNYINENIVSEKTIEMVNVTTNALTSTTHYMLVEENSTEKISIDEFERKQPLIPVMHDTTEEKVSEILNKDSKVKESDEQLILGITVSSIDDQKMTSSNVTEIIDVIIEKEQIHTESSSTMQSLDTNTEKNEFFGEKTPEEVLNKFETEINKVESEKEAVLENSTEKSEYQKEESTKRPKDTSGNTTSQEIFSSITEENQTELEIKLTELPIEPETNTTKADTVKAIETKIQGETFEEPELPEISEDKQEVTEAITEVEPSVNESSTSTIDNRLVTDQKINVTIETSEIFINEKTDDSELEITTEIKDTVNSSNETVTIESTNIETSSDKERPGIPTEYPNKEFEVQSSSEEISDYEQKGYFTEAAISEISSIDLTPSQTPNDKEQDISFNISEESATIIGISTSESRITALNEQSTKGTILQNELTNIEISEVTSSEDDLYQQTEESILPIIPGNDEKRPIESYITTLHPEINKPYIRPEFPDQHIPETDDENVFTPDNADIKNPFNTDDLDSEDYDDQAVYGPGTCRYGGKIYMSAQQIPRDDACDFCFCFRSDIICLQQSCPPPIPGCHEEPIGGFCCPRYECPVSMAISLNLTTTTTTTTTTLPPHFLSHAYKGSAFRGGCQVGNKAYQVGEDIKSKSGPCMSCICGGDGKMKCEPKACSASPMLKEMIAHAAAKKRRR